GLALRARPGPGPRSALGGRRDARPEHRPAGARRAHRARRSVAPAAAARGAALGRHGAGGGAWSDGSAGADAALELARARASGRPARAGAFAAATGAARVLRGDRLRPACAGARGGVRAAIAGGSVGDGARLSPGGGRDLARQVLGGRVRPRLEPIRLPPHAARGADAPPPAAVLRAPRRRDRVRRGVRAAVLGSVLLRRAAPAWRGRGDRALLDPARSGGRRRRGGGAHPTSGVSLQRGLRRLRYQPTASPAASDSSSALFGPWSGGA